MTIHKERGQDYKLIFADSGKQTTFWEEIIRDGSFIDLLVARTSERLLQALDPQGIFIASTYTSNFDSRHGVENRERVCIHFMDLLRQVMLDGGTVYNNMEGENVTSNWLVFMKK